MTGKSVMEGGKVIGWVGTGVMGRWMCEHCIKNGYQVRVYNRTSAKTEPLRRLGATVVDSPRRAAEGAEMVFTIVGVPADVRQVILAPDGVLSGLKPGGIAIDMTTSQPSLAVEIAAEARRRGVAALDAPVSGGDVGAREARLSIMVGGDAAAFERALPLFRCMGKTITHMGGAGQGQHAKMVNQILIAGNMVGVVEGLLYAQRAGLDLSTVIGAVGAGAAGSWSINNLGPRIIKGDFAPGFMVDHFVKDMGIAIEETRRMELRLPGLELARELYVRLQRLGHGRAGTHALMLALAEMNGVAFKCGQPDVSSA